ncbi:MAG: hypothetical protein GX102_01915 [Porphyromonadaceae bacterium]|nr:hypothetical protein [Porphyromonadaceae bacterium]
MKIFRIIVVVLIFTLNLSFLVSAQSTSVTDRTPEQEALKQTEKLQKELSLTAEQVKRIYDINLKYARERKQSNKRTEALDRIRKKNEEISLVLSDKQIGELSSKRTLPSVEIDGERRYPRTDQRNMTEYQSRRATDRPIRVNERQPLSNNQTASVNPNNRPVRASGATQGRSGVGVDNRNTQPTVNRPVRTERTAPSAVRPAERNTDRSASGQSAAPSRENSSRPVRR